MLRTFLMYITFLLVLGGCQTQPPPSSSSSQPQARLDAVALLLDSNSIDSVRIVHDPPGAEHPSRITLDALAEGGANYTLEIRGRAIEPHRRTLAQALRSADARPSTWSGDVNWAVVLYGRTGKEVLRIGLDESGRNAIIDSAQVRVDAGLLRWAESVLRR